MADIHDMYMMRTYSESEMVVPDRFFFSLSPHLSLSPSLQYKKHRLSVGHTNNYAKSVVNMADMVRTLLIVFLESSPQALTAISAEPTFLT